MVQNLHYEIILDLMKNENYVRNIAENLGISHVNVIRKIKDLEGQGVVDYKMSGRNKVYFLKDNIQSRYLIITSEIYKTNKFLSQTTKFKILFEDLIESIDSEMIVLFGSYAKGSSDDKSDIDIYVESKDKAVKQKVKSISTKINAKIGTLDTSTELGREILKNHIIIKGFEKFYEISKQAKK